MRLAEELKSKINKLWEMFWSGGLSNPLSSIEQMSYLIFMKRLEDMDVIQQKRAYAKKEDYTSIFKENEDCRWSEWKHMEAEEMLPHVRDTVFSFIKNLHNGEHSVFSENMKDAVFQITKASLLQEAVSVLDEINIAAQNRDTQGDIYEYLLSELKTAGKNGQFRTPRHIIRMIVELVDPNLNDLICDPACGTAGFLINAYEYILRKYTSSDLIIQDEEGEYYNLIGDKISDQKYWNMLWNDTFFGFDFDSTMIRISLMNMILHGIKAPNIEQKDTLSKLYTENDKYTIVLANPPFTGSIDKSDINDELSIKTTKTELLFVERMFNLLQIGGKCGVIVPEGVLFGSSNAHKKLKEILLLKSQLECVITMPSGVFKPYAGVSTAVLIFTKGGRTENVWFYELESDGYSLDDKRDFIDGKGDIPQIIKRFKTRYKENPLNREENCFFVPSDEIIENNYDLSINQYKEVRYEEVDFEEPDKILSQIIQLENDILINLQKLKDLL